MFRTTTSTAVAGVALIALGALSACSSQTASETTSSAPAASECALTVADPWVKATEDEMTGAFGMITNASDTEVTITAATSPSAGKVEIHEVVDNDGAMVMQPKAGGLVVPASGSAALKPGADHLMLMELSAPIEAGDEVEITATCEGGGTVTWTSVAKPFDGADETYSPMEMEASPSES